MTREMIDGLKRFGLFLADEFSGAQPGEWRAVIIGAEAATDAVEAIALLSAGTPTLRDAFDAGARWVAQVDDPARSKISMDRGFAEFIQSLPAPPSDGDQR